MLPMPKDIDEISHKIIELLRPYNLRVCDVRKVLHETELLLEYVVLCENPPDKNKAAHG